VRKFDYFRPSSVKEACDLLSELGNEAKILAGGTDLLVQMKLNKIRPGTVVTLRDVAGLASIRTMPDSGIGIGTMMTLRQIEKSQAFAASHRSVSEAACWVGSPQIRSRATIGGNLSNAAPSADMAPVLLAYEATAVITNGEQERSVPLKMFFKGPGQSDLKPGEILKEILLPPPKQVSFATYLKANRSRMDIALVGVAVSVSVDPSTRSCSELRLALGAVAPTPFLVEGVEDKAIGSMLDDRLVNGIAYLAKEQARPISDLRATADYRRTLVEVLTRRALRLAQQWIADGARQ
jgi:aerobic carbon-monoxide dehydrogenase medium subunit